MDLSNKAKIKIDETSKKVEEAIDRLKREIAELTHNAKDKLKGTGEELQESLEALVREVKELSDKGRELISGSKKGDLKEAKLWDRIQRGMETGFDAALSAVHNITERAGEGIEITRLRREKAQLETQLTRLLAKLGNSVYENISEQRLDDIAERLGIKDILLDISEREARMLEIERRLGKELKDQGDTTTSGDENSQ